MVGACEWTPPAPFKRHMLRHPATKNYQPPCLLKLPAMMQLMGLCMWWYSWWFGGGKLFFSPLLFSLLTPRSVFDQIQLCHLVCIDFNFSSYYFGLLFVLILMFFEVYFFFNIILTNLIHLIFVSNVVFILLIAIFCFYHSLSLFCFSIQSLIIFFNLVFIPD